MVVPEANAALVWASGGTDLTLFGGSRNLGGGQAQRHLGLPELENVIPAKAGIHLTRRQGEGPMGPGFRRGDNFVFGKGSARLTR